MVLCTVRTGGIALLGAMLFQWLDIPLPILLGPMFACMLAALAGMPMKEIKIIGTLSRTVIGVAAGASVTVGMVQAVPGIALSALFIPLLVVLIGLCAYPVLRYGFGFDSATAYFGVMPGGLQDMLVFGEQAGGNVRIMSLLHAIRVLCLVSFVTFGIEHLAGIDLTAPPGQSSNQIPPHEIMLMLVAGLVGWQIAYRIGMFGSAILGPLILAAVFSLTGLIHHRPSAEMIWFAQFFIGLSVGVKYTGIRGSEIRIYALAGLVNSAITLLLGVLVAGMVAWVFSFSPLDVLLAFVPGGQGEMLIIAIIAGADLTYVTIHHVVRLLIVMVCAPLFIRLFQ